jgi:hypothetical protein
MKKGFFPPQPRFEAYLPPPEPRCKAAAGASFEKVFMRARNKQDCRIGTFSEKLHVRR